MTTIELNKKETKEASADYLDYKILLYSPFSGVYIYISR